MEDSESCFGTGRLNRAGDYRSLLWVDKAKEGGGKELSLARPDDPFSGIGMANWAKDSISPLWLGEAVSTAGLSRDGAPDNADLSGDGIPGQGQLRRRRDSKHDRLRRRQDSERDRLRRRWDFGHVGPPEPKSGIYPKWTQVTFRLRTLWFPHPV